MGSTHYFDTSALNQLADSPHGESFVRTIHDKTDDELFVSPINVEEIKLASVPRRSQLVKLLNELRSQIRFLKHPDILSWMEFEQALRGRQFNGNLIFETDPAATKDFHAFLDDPVSTVMDEERQTIEHRKLLNRYIQITTRKEPKGRHSYSEVEKSRAELMTLSDSDLKEKIREWGKIDLVNQPYEEKDVDLGLRFRLIEILVRVRPQIRYFFDKESGPAMLKISWPNKQKDRVIAGRIMKIDFKKSFPGSWMRDSVYFAQASRPIGPGNLADGAHAFYLPYVGLFWTSDETLFRIMKGVRISSANYCGEVCYVQHSLKKP